MLRWASVALAIVVAAVYGALGVYYLLPAVYHPFTTDTLHTTQSHLAIAAVFLVLAAGSLIVGAYSRPPSRAR